MNWHYVHEGQQHGPVTDTELARLFHSGTITADTPVWHDGLADWIPFHAAQVTTSLPPPLPPLNPGEVTCAECGRVFPESETIRHGNVCVCAACKPRFLQKLAEGAAINTGALTFAGFGIRLGAKILDGLILGVPFLIVFFVLVGVVVRGTARGHGANPAMAPGLIMALELVALLVQIGYQIFFLGRFGATPGKMACHIKVVMADGRPIGYGRAAGRAFAEMISGFTCYIGYFMVLFDKEKRALHDHICNTRVIHQ